MFGSPDEPTVGRLAPVLNPVPAGQDSGDTLAPASEPAPVTSGRAIPPSTGRDVVPERASSSRPQSHRAESGEDDTGSTASPARGTADEDQDAWEDSGGDHAVEDSDGPEDEFEGHEDDD